MLKKIFKYIYHYGLWALFCRCFDHGYRPQKMGFAWMLRHGVYRVGTLWAVPTRMSFRVWNMLRSAKKIRIFLTIPEWWGGGAVYYLNQQIALSPKDNISILVSPAGFLRGLTIRFYDGSDFIMKCYVNNLAVLGGLRTAKVKDIVVSTVVAWHDVIGQSRIDHIGIAELMRQILQLKQTIGCKLVYLLHDYYCICPRLFLVGDDGQYCYEEYTGQKCNECCSKDVNCVEQIAGGTNVGKWRDTMSSFLSEVDEIRAFCTDTVNRMQRIFPNFEYTLLPHPEPRAIKRQPLIKYESMHIGLIGNISQNKGVDVVYAFAQWLGIRHHDVKLTIIGNWYSSQKCPSNVVTTGSYQQGELPGLIENTGVNVIWFSSTFPETFSYVMHEIIQLGLPVACFDRGAQKDCALGYKRGRVISSLQPDVIWDCLCRLFDDVKCEAYLARNDSIF